MSTFDPSIQGGSALSDWQLTLPLLCVAFFTAADLQRGAGASVYLMRSRR